MNAKPEQPQAAFQQGLSRILNVTKAQLDEKLAEEAASYKKRKPRPKK